MKRIALLICLFFIFLPSGFAQLDSNWYALDNLYVPIGSGASDWCYTGTAVNQTVGFLTFTESSGSYTCQSHSAVPKQTGGVVSKDFSFTYGVVKARIQFGEPGNTVFSALWMLGGDATSSAYPSTCIPNLEASSGTAFAVCASSAETNYEFDIAESPSSSGAINENYLEWQSGSATVSDGSGVFMPFDPSSGYHTYELDWFPTRLVYKVDGVAYRTKTHSVNVPMFLIIDQELTAGATSYPVTTSVQWIRVCSDPMAVCYPGDPTTIFEDTFGYPPAATPVDHAKQGTTSQGVSTQ